MASAEVLTGIRNRIHNYFVESLLPFWTGHGPDPEYGGFLSYFDRNGSPTGETVKTFLMQIRFLYSMSSSHRAGYGGGDCERLARYGADFILENYWDDEEEGWVWIAERDGTPTVLDKIGYGQCFALYTFSEYFLATGDPRGREAADRTYAAIQKHMADSRHGGYFELMERDWSPKPAGKTGGDRKSLDVHMHLMEALTTYYEMTGHPTHRRRLIEVVELILTKMLHPGNGLGYIHFSYDWTPLPRIIFSTEWGRDAMHESGEAPIDQTSPGHNVELIWLLLHAADVLWIDKSEYAGVVRPICDHCVKFGIDHEYGGVYADTPMERPTESTEKQYWQQSEVLIGMLDAYALLGDEKYLDAFFNTERFLFSKFVNLEAGGEWYERLDREGNIVDGVLAHAWKINYHTIRSMIQTITRLDKIQI
jgi:mannobiose 2-epimerase